MDNLIELFLIIVLNLILVLLFDKIKIFKFTLDNPDGKRKFHLNPTPLAGGTLIILNIFFILLLSLFTKDFLFEKNLFQAKSEFYYFFSISLLIYSLGFADDKIDLNPNLKFFLLIVIISSLIFLDHNIVLRSISFSFYDEIFFLDKYLSLIFTIFCFLVFLNAFNMFDGINLQSCIYSIIVFIYISLIYFDSLFIKLIIIPLIAFAYLNYKNKSFLGDSGTLLLGFLISFIVVKLYNSKIIEYADDIILIMIIPGLDLIRIFFLRISNKKNPFKPDRSHIHHILLKKYGQMKTILILIGLILFPLSMNQLSISNAYIIILTILIYSLIISLSQNRNSNYSSG